MAALLLVGCSTADRPSVATVTGTRDSTTLQVQADTCNQSPSIRAEESEEEVRLVVTASEGDGSECLDPAEPVVLDVPLGERTLVDDATGEVLRLAAPED
jgi:hypothetical protein